MALEKLTEKLDKLVHLAKEMELNYLAQEVEALQSKLIYENFYVVVVGLFKRGKSSLINSLLEADLAPVAITPLTSTITLFKYSEKPYAEITFNDGTKKDVDLKLVNDYISEEHNPGNIKQVMIVTILHNAPLLQSINLIDTPGLGSIYEHNTETTIQFISKIDVALLVLSADTPISKIDTDFLLKMKETVPEFLFVLNKADLLPDADISKMTAYNNKIITDLLPGREQAVEIIPVTTRPTESPLIKDSVTRLRSRLESLAGNEKGRILEISTVKQFHILRQQLAAMIQLQMEGLMMPVNALEQKVQSFISSKDLMLKNKGEFESIINIQIKEIDRIVHQALVEESKKVEEDIKREIRKAFLAGTANQEFRESLDNLILTRFKQAKNKMEIAITDQFRSLLQEYSRRSQNFLNEMLKQLSSLMNMDFDVIASKFDLNAYTAFYFTFHIEHSPIDSNNWFDLFLSKEKKIEKQIKRWEKHYHAILVTNTTAIIYDLQYKAQEGLRKFNYDLNRDFEELLSNIEKVLRNTLKQKNESSSAIAGKAKHVLQLMQEMNAV